MMFVRLAERLWGEKSKFCYLLIAAILMLFTLLGSKEIWTQEHRWADIVYGMFYRNDFLHPYLGRHDYYDKPLLSYWLIAIVSKITDAFTTWELRIPSALAGIVALWSTYALGKNLKNKNFGLLAGWLLLTTYYFIFWARTSSADMLNLAGTMLALAWYFQKREQPSFYNYFIFFLIVAITCLCKGLTGALVPAIGVAVDMTLQKTWKQNLRASLFLSLIPALIIYLAPFLASSFIGDNAYGQNGLYLVYRENILRFFQPFDHEGSVYTYFVYLPVYTLPWAVFFIPALLTLPRRWKTLSTSSKWIIWTLLFSFIFFTLSGSRRSYYVLPLVPFAILFTADWLADIATKSKRIATWSSAIIASAFLVMFSLNDLLPAWYYSQIGVERFANTLKTEATTIQPWSQWHVVLLDAESKLKFYLQLGPETRNYQIKGYKRDSQNEASLLETWPMVLDKPKNTIFITRKIYLPLLQSHFAGYHIVAMPPAAHSIFGKVKDDNESVAFVPVA